MDLEKVLYTVFVAFTTIFLMSAALIITNTLNMWLVAIVSLVISIVSFLTMKSVKKQDEK